MTSPDARTPLFTAARFTLTALFLMNLLNYVDRFILAAVLEQIRHDIPMEGWQAGLVGSIFYVSYALFSPVVGWLGDRVVRKYLLAIAVGVWSIATYATGLCQNFEQLLLARSLLGIGEATYAILAPTFIADLYPANKRNRALTIFYIAVPLGAAIGFPLGSHLYHAFDSWRPAFSIVGLPGLLVALAALGLREPRRGGMDHDSATELETLPARWDVYAALLKNRSFIYNTLGMAMFTFALGGLSIWAPEFYHSVRHIDKQEADQRLGIVLALSGLGGTALGGLLADRFLHRWRGAYFKVCGLTMLASLPFLLVALLAENSNLIFGSMLLGLTLAFMNIGPSNAILTNVTPARIRAAGVAVNLFSIHFMGDIPSPPLMGLISDMTGNLFWGVAITLPAILLGGVFFLMGAPFLEADQEAALGRKAAPPVEEGHKQLIAPG